MKDNLIRCEIIQANSCLCVSGCGQEESVDQLFVGSGVFGQIWPLICQWLGICLADKMHIIDHFIHFEN